MVLVLNNDNLDYLHLNARYSADLYSMLTKSRRGTIAPLDIKCHCVSVQNGHHLWKFNIFQCCSKPFFKFKSTLWALSAIFVQETNENIGSTLIVFLHMKFCYLCVQNSRMEMCKRGHYLMNWNNEYPTFPFYTHTIIISSLKIIILDIWLHDWWNW